MALGRFINLAMINLGGYRVKLNRMGTFGCLMPFTLVENDKAAIDVGWKPYHMQQGYGLNESTFSCASAINWGNNLVPASSDPETIKNMIAWDAVEKQQMAVGSGMPRVYRTFLLTPDVAKDLAKAYKSKDELESALIRTARTPLAMRAYANYYGSPGSAFDPQTCPLSAQEKLLGETEMAEKGYAPLETFKIASNLKPDVPKPRVRGYDRPGVRADHGDQTGRRRPGMGQGMRRRPPIGTVRH